MIQYKPELIMFSANEDLFYKRIKFYIKRLEEMNYEIFDIVKYIKRCYIMKSKDSLLENKKIDKIKKELVEDFTYIKYNY